MVEAGKRIFEFALERVRHSFSLCVYGYVVMPEHVHLLVSEPERGLLGDALKSQKQGVSRRMGARPGISGRSVITISTSGTIASLWRSFVISTGIP